MTKLLDQHYGGGLIYLVEPEDKSELIEARARGLVNSEGFLTPEGYRYWANGMSGHH